MPASEVQKLYREGKLHSGPGGPIVKNPKQATAIQISMARKEGHTIPKPKGSFQTGGTAPDPVSTLVPTPQETASRKAQAQDIAGRTRQAERSDWLANIRESAGHPPYENLTRPGPDMNNPGYAVQGLQGNILERQRADAIRAMEPYSNRSRIVVE